MAIVSSPPRLVIAGTASGVGKTTFAIGLMAALGRTGRRVQAFKAGPDYIDPTYHTQVTGRPSRNLDAWLLSAATVRELFARAAADADIAVIEGVMGLFDGYTGLDEAGSTAQLAKLLGAPVLLVVNADKMARSAAATVLGYKTFDPAVNVAGVLLRGIASPSHYEWVKAPIETCCGVPVLGSLPEVAALEVPERHLGLVPAPERPLDAAFVDALVKEVLARVDLDRVVEIARGAAPLAVDAAPAAPVAATPGGRAPRIAVARDRAFCFYYEDNLDALRRRGAELVFFSPLDDLELPAGVGLVYLGGGFPELHLAALEGNGVMRQDLRRKIGAGLPVYAECGGLLYLVRELVDAEGRAGKMVGGVGARARMTRRAQGMGYISVRAVADTWLCPAGTEFRAHEFHYSELFDLAPGTRFAFEVTKRPGRPPKPDGLTYANVIASYAHVHFAGAPALADALVRRATAPPA